MSLVYYCLWQLGTLGEQKRSIFLRKTRGVVLRLWLLVYSTGVRTDVVIISEMSGGVSLKAGRFFAAGLVEQAGRHGGHAGNRIESAISHKFKSGSMVAMDSEESGLQCRVVCPAAEEN